MTATSPTWSSPVRDGKNPPQRALPIPPNITTVDPCRLTDDQYFDISQSRLRTHFRKMRSQQLSDPHERQFGDQIQTADTLFPAGTRGFLYYYSPPNQNPIGGGLRFRVAEAPGKAAFLAGHDLLMPHGLPWHLPVWEIVVRGAYGGLLGVLEQDGFAPRALQAACRALNVSRDSVFVTALGQPWAVNWASEWSRIYIARPNANPVAAIVRHPWYCMGSARAAPYTGRGLVSLIRIPTPTALPPPDAHSFDPSLALRIDAVHTLRAHAVNHRTLAPAPGATALFRPRLIHRSTKVAPDVMDAQVHAVLRPAGELPWARPPRAGREGEELFEVYRHREPQVGPVPEPVVGKKAKEVVADNTYSQNGNDAPRNADVRWAPPPPPADGAIISGHR